MTRVSSILAMIAAAALLAACSQESDGTATTENAPATEQNEATGAINEENSTEAPAATEEAPAATDEGATEEPKTD